MADSIVIRHNLPALSAKLRRRLVSQYPRAAVAAINKTAQGAFTRSVRAVQQDVGASSQKTIRRNLKLARATQQKPEAQIEARSGKKERIPIFELKPRPRRPQRRPRGAGVVYGPAQKLIPSSFVAKMPSGHTGVFARTGDFVIMKSGLDVGKRKEQIAERFGPSVALVFSRKKIIREIQKFISERIPIEMSRAFARFGT